MAGEHGETRSDRIFEFCLTLIGFVTLMTPLGLWLAWSETVFYVVLASGLGAMALTGVLVRAFPERRQRFTTRAEAPQPLPATAVPVTGRPNEAPRTPGNPLHTLIAVVALLLGAGLGLLGLVYLLL